MPRPPNTIAKPAAFRERRRFERHGSLIRARLISAHSRHDGVVLDVSVNGVKLRLDTPPAPGAPVILALAGSVHFGGEVAWRQGNLAGIAFRQRPEQLAEVMAAAWPGQARVFGHA